MTVSAKWFGKALMAAFGGATSGEAPLIDFLSDTIKVALCTSSYTPDQDTHDFFDDITNEVTGTGYTAGGATLGTKTLGYTAGTNVVKFDAADVAWTTATITARYAIIYKDTGTASTSPLMGYVDFGADVHATADTFTITHAAAGIFTLTAS